MKDVKNQEYKEEKDEEYKNLRIGYKLQVYKDIQEFLEQSKVWGKKSPDKELYDRACQVFLAFERFVDIDELKEVIK